MSTLRFLRRLAGQLKGWPHTDEYTDSHLFTSPQLLSASHFIQFISLPQRQWAHFLLYASFQAFELAFYHDYKFMFNQILLCTQSKRKKAEMFMRQQQKQNYLHQQEQLNAGFSCHFFHLDHYQNTNIIFSFNSQNTTLKHRFVSKSASTSSHFTCMLCAAERFKHKR